MMNLHLAPTTLPWTGLPVGTEVPVLNAGAPTGLTVTRRSDRVWMISGTLPDGSHLPAGYEATPGDCLGYAAGVYLENRADRAEAAHDRRWGPL